MTPAFEPSETLKEMKEYRAKLDLAIEAVERLAQSLPRKRGRPVGSGKKVVEKEEAQ